MVDDLGCLGKDHKWKQASTLSMVEAIREINGVASTERRYYISSLQADAERMGTVVRGHWGVENGLHWVMDVTFRDDQCRIRTDHAPANFTTIKHMALNLIRRARGKDSLRLRRKVAAWDDDFLASLIAA